MQVGRRVLIAGAVGLLSLAGVALASPAWAADATIEVAPSGNSTTSCSSPLASSFTGQSFTAPITGYVTSVGLYPANSVTEYTGDPVRFYEGVGMSGTLIGATSSVVWSSPVYQFPLLAQLQTVTLATPIPVVAGESYSFVFPDTCNAVSGPTAPFFITADGDAYAGGSLLSGGTTPVPADLAFVLTFSTTPASPEAAPIPPWIQAYGRFGADAGCETGWDPSWQEWAEPVTGGWVCTRSIPSLG